MKWAPRRVCDGHTLKGIVLHAFASQPRPLYFLNKKGPSRLKGQPCCRAKKSSHGSCVTLQMCYFQKEVSSVCKV